jgi:hypothetical protein
MISSRQRRRYTADEADRCRRKCCHRDATGDPVSDVEPQFELTHYQRVQPLTEPEVSPET